MIIINVFNILESGIFPERKIEHAHLSLSLSVCSLLDLVTVSSSSCLFLMSCHQNYFALLRKKFAILLFFWLTAVTRRENRSYHHPTDFPSFSIFSFYDKLKLIILLTGSLMARVDKRGHSATGSLQFEKYNIILSSCHRYLFLIYFIMLEPKSHCELCSLII